MKKLSVTIALILCLVLSAFAFASCGKKKTDATTAPTTAAPSTTSSTVSTTADTTAEHVHVPGDAKIVDVDPTCSAAGTKSFHCTDCGLSIPGTEEEIPKLDHTPEDHYTTITYPTCIAVGYEAYLCEVCGEVIDSTIRELEIDPEAHSIASWDEDDISLLNPTGTKTGHCAYCNRDIVKDIAYEPRIWNANDKASGNKVDKRLYSAIRGEDHFYPTEGNGNVGNDLLIEFSILYNDTLATLPGASFDITVGDGSDFVNIKLSSDANARYGTVVGGFSARDRNDGKGAILSTPSADAIAANPDAKYPSIGDYGWHRVAIRIHEEATIAEGAVAYTYTGEAYLDGKLILAFDLSKWAAGNPGVLLFTAKIEDGNLVYADNDAANAFGEIAIYDFYKSENVYCAIADTYMTCGHDFVQSVVSVADPADATLAVAEGVELPAKMWYAAQHDHVAATEYTVDLAPTCTVPGSKSYHCTICGAIIPETVTAIDPTGDAHTPAADFTVDTPATCSAAGSKSKHCTVCGAIIPETVEEIPTVAHTPATDYTVDVAATCSAAGSKSKHCTECDAIIPETVEAIAIDPNAHVVTDWTVTAEATLLSDGSRNGDCTLCSQNVVEVITFAPTVKTCTDSSSGSYKSKQFNVREVQGDGHFYPTAGNPEGNDLLIEFSILWNPTMLNLNASSDPYCATRLDGSSKIANLTYWSGSDSPKGSWCPYAGGFEGAALTTGGPAGMMKDHGDYADYPNIGGSVAPADAENLDNGHEWGWHRFGIRIHHEVTNLSALLADDAPGKTAAKYKTTITVYFDGVEIYSAYGDLSGDRAPYRLFTASSNGDGTVTYTDIDAAVNAVPFVINTTKAQSGKTAYIVIADVSATMGDDFAMDVERVATPAAATYEVAEGVELPAAMYFKAKVN